MSKSTEWVDRYDPERSSIGFNLILYKRRIPLLMDMDGRIVHAWQDVRASGRARLLPNGNLAVIGEGGAFEEYDWDGSLTWSYLLEDADTFLHHDFILLENDHFLLLAHDPARNADFLLEVDRAGSIVWRWDAAEHLAADFDRAGQRNNKTHVNSVHELPANRWFDSGNETFRPGNILISARNLNAIYLIDRPGGEVVWQLHEGLDYQHEAIMIPPGRRGAGNIVYFNNGYNDLYAFRQSGVVELNPVTKEIVWEFRKRGFYSSTGGIQQSLPNGNLLVTSSQGGRVFEVAKDGAIVWQWSPPYLPMRVARYPADFNDRLARLERPARTPIDRRDPARFVDANLYAFALPHESVRVKESDRTRMVLKEQNRCQTLLLPAHAKVRLGYGRWIEESSTPYISHEARFVVTVREVESNESVVLLDHTVGAEELPTHEGAETVKVLQETARLEEFSNQTVELCLNLTSATGGPASDEFVWEEPVVQAPARWAQFGLEDELDPEALEQQEKHLKAIGYIN